MRVLSVFPKSWIILLTCKTCQTFIINIDSPWIHWCNAYIKSEIKFQSVDKERISYISANDAILVNRYFWNVIDDIYTFALWWVLWFDDPHVILLFRSQTMEVRIKISKLIWKYIRVRYDIETFLAEFFLHLYNIFTKSVFPCEFTWIREMVDLLVFM